MERKELKQLSRKELLEMLIIQSKELEKLQKELDDARTELEDRRIRTEKSGTLAHASLMLNRVFESADAAAKQYLYNIEETKKEAERDADAALADAKKRCREMEQETELLCSEKKHEINALIKKLNGEICEYRLRNPDLPISDFSLDEVPEN